MLSLVSASAAHISLAPSSVGSGARITTTMKIPHGNGQNQYTSQIRVKLPRGLESAAPEDLGSCWMTNYTMYQLPEEDQWEGYHGSKVTHAPDTMVWTVTSPECALHTDHIMSVMLNLKIGCNFEDAVDPDLSPDGTHSVWNGQHTLWFRTEQHSNTLDQIWKWKDEGNDLFYLKPDEVSLWTGARAGGETVGEVSWNPPKGSTVMYGSAEETVKACPYMMIFAGSKCTHLDEDHPAGGMIWMGKYVPEVENMDEVRHEQQVIDLANEAALDAIELHLNEVGGYASKDDMHKALDVAIAALCMSALSAGLLLGLCLFRAANKKQFTAVLLGADIPTQKV
jgi:hypothetical protein